MNHKKETFALQVCTGILFAAGIAICFYFLTILMYVFY